MVCIEIVFFFEDELCMLLVDFDVILLMLWDNYLVEVFVDVLNLCVKIFVNFGVGYNYIDVEVVIKVGFMVINISGVVIDVIVDIVMILILMFCCCVGEGE